MKQHIIIALLIFTLTLVGCGNKSVIENNVKETQEIISTENIEEDKIDEYGTLDTTIYISGIKTSNYNGEVLTLEIAEEILYQHYVKKGYFRSDKIPKTIKKEDENKFAVYFDTTHLINLNNSKYSDAVISFWLTPPRASGHCWQPHKAVISDTDKGYIINNEEFIPPNFSIDSIVSQNNKRIIYGYDYDCGNHKVLRNLRLAIEIDKK